MPRRRRSAPAPTLLTLAVLILGGATAATFLWLSEWSAPSETGTGTGVDAEVALAALAAVRTATDGEPHAAPCFSSGRSRRPCGPTLAVDAASPEDIVTRDDLAVVRRDDELTGIGLPDLAVRWRSVPLPGDGALRLRDGDDTVLVTSASAVAALEPRTGAVRWRAELLEADPTTRPAEAWTVDDTVLALSSEGTLHALRLADGEERWRRSGAGQRPMATPDGLVVLRDGAIAHWGPASPEPTWQQLDSHLDVRRPVAGEPAPGPVPLMQNRGLLDLTDGEVVRPDGLGATRYLVLPTGTVELRWPRGVTEAEVALLAPDGATRWRREGVPLTCCVTATTPTAPGELAIAAPGEPPRVFDLADGSDVPVPRRDGAELAATTPQLLIWRDGDRLVAEHRRSGREAFRAEGQLWATDPLLVRSDDGVVVLADVGELAPGDVGRPGPRPPASAQAPT